MDTSFQPSPPLQGTESNSPETPTHNKWDNDTAWFIPFILFHLQWIFPGRRLAQDHIHALTGIKQPIVSLLLRMKSPSTKGIKVEMSRTLHSLFDKHCQQKKLPDSDYVIDPHYVAFTEALRSELRWRIYQYSGRAGILGMQKSSQIEKIALAMNIAEVDVRNFLEENPTLPEDPALCQPISLQTVSNIRHTHRSLCGSYRFNWVQVTNYLDSLPDKIRKPWTPKEQPLQVEDSDKVEEIPEQLELGLEIEEEQATVEEDNSIEVSVDPKSILVLCREGRKVRIRFKEYDQVETFILDDVPKARGVYTTLQKGMDGAVYCKGTGKAEYGD